MMLFSLLLILTLAKDRQHYFNGYFNGRSPNVQVLGDLKQGENNLILFGGNVKTASSDVAVTDMGDVLARSFWVGKLKSTSAVELTGDLPSASLNLFTFGVDADDEKRLENNNLFSNMKRANLLVPFHPADHTSIVTSALTGQVPREHGVVGARWHENGLEKEAFSDAYRSPAMVGAVELLKTNYPSLDLTTGSEHEIVTRALSHNLFEGSHFSQNQFNSNTKEYNFNWEDLKKKLTEDQHWMNLEKNVQAFDLDHEWTQKFLMEMEFLNRVADNMEAKKDQLQVFNLATTSLEDVSEVNDDMSTILAATLEKLLTKYQEAFPQGASQLAFIKTPEMHLTEAHESLESKLAEMDLTHDKARLKAFELLQVCDDDDYLCLLDAANETTPGQMETTYQISVWLMFMLTLAITFFSFFFGCMNYTSDALLFTRWNRNL